jgi:class 3 adenylate cyclase/predicted ATPase
MNVADWLIGIGLEQYLATFTQNDIDAGLLSKLTSEDLRDMGIASVGHRRRLLEAISKLSGDLETVNQADADKQPVGKVEQPVGERRQVTVMFCDMADFTGLSTRLDPEDLSQLIRAYQSCLSSIIRQFDGFIARYVGDGVLAYFGWPKARETDPERAVRAALEIIPAIRRMPTLADRVHIRIGIATGLVIVGEPIGTGEAWQQTAIGETPNLAARLQALAQPDTVVIAEGTRQIIGDLFDYKDLGVVALKGIAKPVPAWQVLGSSKVESRFEALRGSTLAPLCGRNEEVATLVRRWRHATQNEGRVVLLSGEPGIGKSRLVTTLQERINDEPHIRLRYFCSPYHLDSALHPFVTQIERAARFVQGDSRETRLEKLTTLIAQASQPGQEDVALLAELLSIASASEICPSLDLAPQRKKERTFEVILQQLDALAQRQPVLIVFEDVHWIDPSSRGLLDLIIERLKHLRVLLVVTFRPEFLAPWTGEPHVTAIALSRLGPRDATALIEGLAGDKAAIPDDVVAEIIERTDGIPLFAEELTKAVLETSARVARDIVSTIPRTGLSVPPTLHASLIARLDRLGSEALAVAQVGAAIGREFSYELLVAAHPASDQLPNTLERLVETGLVLRRDIADSAIFRFKHALVRDVAYSTLLRGPRQAIHGQIAAVLARRGTVEPELLAHHFFEAEQHELASRYWLEAGRRASQRSANLEAIAHSRKGIAALGNVPYTPEKAKLELSLHLVLGPVLIATKGWSTTEVELTYRRALELAQQLCADQEGFSAAWGLWFFHVTNGEPETASALVKDLFAVADRLDDPALRLQAHHAGWPTELVLGNLGAAREHLAQGLSLYDEDKHREQAFMYGGHDVTVCGKGQGSLVLWLLGYPDQAMQSAHDAVTLGERLAHVPTLVHGYMWTALAYRLCRDLPSVRVCGERLITLGTEHKLQQYHAIGNIWSGWTSVQHGRISEGISVLRQGLAGHTAQAKLLSAPFHAVLAEAYYMTGDSRPALDAIDLAIDISERNSERFLYADMLRLRGQILLATSGDRLAEAEACYRRALDISRAQNAKSL